MHRDDLHLRRRLAAVAATRLPLQLDGATIVLVDDVAFTGRTCRAAMDALSSFGRPARIQFARSSIAAIASFRSGRIMSGKISRPPAANASSCG
jgi:predicted phosphoribosyltransferase